MPCQSFCMSEMTRTVERAATMYTRELGVLRTASEIKVRWAKGTQAAWERGPPIGGCQAARYRAANQRQVGNLPREQPSDVYDASSWNGVSEPVRSDGCQKPHPSISRREKRPVVLRLPYQDAGVPGNWQRSWDAGTARCWMCRQNSLVMRLVERRQGIILAKKSTSKLQGTLMKRTTSGQTQARLTSFPTCISRGRSAGCETTSTFLPSGPPIDSGKEPPTPSRPVHRARLRGTRVLNRRMRSICEICFLVHLVTIGF